MVELPEKYTVRENPAVGVDYLDENGDIVFQHPIDSDSARRLVWMIWQQRNGRENAILQRSHFLGLADALDKQWKITDKYK